MRKSLFGVLLLLVATAAAPPPEKHDPDFVVFRPVSTDSACGAATATLDGRIYYFDDARWLLDLRDIDVNACKAREGPDGDWKIYGKLTADGGRVMAQWTERNINNQLGIFVDGTLVSAPVIRSKIEDAFVIEGAFTMAEAQRLVRRMRHGLPPK